MLLNQEFPSVILSDSEVDFKLSKFLGLGGLKLALSEQFIVPESISAIGFHVSASEGPQSAKLGPKKSLIHHLDRQGSAALQRVPVVPKGVVLS